MLEIFYPKEIVAPNPTSLEELRLSFPKAISWAKELSERENLKTPEGKFALTFLLATGSLLKAAGVNLDRNIGGRGDNPEKEIDLVGGEIADHLIREFISQSFDYAGTEMYIEERKKWEVFPKSITALAGKNARLILIDPCDETSSPNYRSVGVSIFDKDGKFISGGVAGVRDEIAVFIEGERVNFVGFEGGKNSLKDPLSLKAAPGVPSSLGVATLQRRMEGEEAWKLLDRVSPNGLVLTQTFGGFGLIKMLKGEIDLMIDASKGQPWYEAGQWGVLAERLGFSVEYDLGRIPNAAHILTKKTPERIPVVISRNSHIHERVLQALNR